MFGFINQEVALKFQYVFRSFHWHRGRKGHELLAKTVKQLIYYLLVVTSPSGQGTRFTRDESLWCRTNTIHQLCSVVDVTKTNQIRDYIGNGIGNLGHLTTWTTWQAAMEMRLIGCVKNSGCCRKVSGSRSLHATANGDFPFQPNWLVLELIFLLRGLKTAAPHIIWMGAGGEKVFWGSNKGSIADAVRRGRGGGSRQAGAWRTWVAWRMVWKMKQKKQEVKALHAATAADSWHNETETREMKRKNKCCSSVKRFVVRGTGRGRVRGWQAVWEAVRDKGFYFWCFLCGIRFRIVSRFPFSLTIWPSAGFWFLFC